MKINLKVRPDRPGMWRNPDMPPTKHIKKSLPFVENDRAVLIHRVKRIEQHQLPGRRPHLSVHMWCGQTQCGSTKFTFHDDPPKDKLVCHNCEILAVSLGELPSDTLVGRHVCKGKLKAVRTCRHKK